MTLSNLLKTAYVNKGVEAGVGLFDIMEEVARDYLTNELYEQAASLFDPDTIIDTEEDEYQRGVAELIMSFTGQGSDDLDDIASIISERTSTAHMLTAADFVQVGDNLLYIGPFAEAVKFIRANCDVTKDAVRSIQTGLWTVELDGGNVWGHGDTAEMAWRYAMGAEFGPIDAEFTPFRLTVK